MSYNAINLGTNETDTAFGRKSQELLEKLQTASKELVSFINENCCPHDIVVVEQGTVYLYNGRCAFQTEIPD